eukprot:snap_masked-scaffold_71-processed-gene-0.19-mRNA-1 protein AED:0.03 eAED:0.03 QI:0/0/0/1/1/1/2/0/316
MKERKIKTEFDSFDEKNKEYILDVDAILTKLLSAIDKPAGTQVNLELCDINLLLHAARKKLLEEPMLLELLSPLVICGDIHGQYYDLLRIFKQTGFPPKNNYLFLGDYVDRANQSIETTCLLLCYKIKYPNNFFLLRGNHECSSINKVYGFYDECKRRYNIKLWKTFCDIFNCLPISALINNRIFCMHGGLSKDLEDITMINSIKRPCIIPEEGLLCDILWSDPTPYYSGYQFSDRGVSYVFGHDVIKKFIQEHDLDLICRAHQVVEDGYEFQANRKIVTIFSAPNYCGEFDNAAALMTVSEDLVCSFQILTPPTK